MSGHELTLKSADVEDLSSKISDFLNSGWCLALDSERIAMGWGDFEVRARGAGDAELYFPDFFLRSENFRAVFSEWRIVSRRALGQSLDPDLEPHVNLRWQEPKRQDFLLQFEKIRQRLKEGDLKKAVPVVFAEASADLGPLVRRKILAEAMKAPTPLFPYGFWRRGEGMIGVTPEILFTQSSMAVRGGESESILDTAAIAGTRAREEGASERLLADPKERHEHQLVVDDLREVLTPLGEMKVGETSVLELPSLVHLKTQLQVRLQKPLSFEDCLRLLHPTPALGVAPRSLGFSEMMTWDSAQDRRRFGAPFGIQYRDGKGGESRHCIVAIRNVQWRESEVVLGSGCGVVPASDPDREWEELRLKRESVKRMLRV